MMQSELKLHPATILFKIASQIRSFLIPAVIAFLSTRSNGRFNEDLFLIVLFVPAIVLSVVQYMTFRLRYDANELVIRSGLIFRNERHIPYARIQNIDASQNVMHRLFRVVEVRLQTGSGEGVEAKLSVLPIGAVAEMRRRVFERGARLVPEGEVQLGEVAQVAQRGRVLLSLKPGELSLAGLIENRGMVLVLAAAGLVWEYYSRRVELESVIGNEISGSGVVRDFVRSLAGDAGMPIGRILAFTAAIAALLMFVRIVSTLWGLIRLYGFTLSRDGDDLRTEYGLFTRVTASIPIRRIQSITIREGALHRIFRRASVRVATAGGGAAGQESSEREWLAPIIRTSTLDAFLREIEPDLEVRQLDWQPAHPRAFMRIARISNAWALVLSVAPFVFISPVAGSILFVALVFRGIARARTYTRNLGWALTEDAVAFRTGWLWRTTHLARLNKIQVVASNASPFDRRTGMADISVDTAGMVLRMPYLSSDVAEELRDRLSARAAVTAFRW